MWDFAKELQWKFFTEWRRTWSLSIFYNLRKVQKLDLKSWKRKSKLKKNISLRIKLHKNSKSKNKIWEKMIEIDFFHIKFVSWNNMKKRGVWGEKIRWVLDKLKTCLCFILRIYPFFFLKNYLFIFFLKRLLTVFFWKDYWQFFFKAEKNIFKFENLCTSKVSFLTEFKIFFDEKFMSKKSLKFIKDSTQEFSPKKK